MTSNVERGDDESDTCRHLFAHSPTDDCLLLQQLILRHSTHSSPQRSAASSSPLVLVIMRCVAWYCACFLTLFCLGSSPRYAPHSPSCSSSAVSGSSSASSQSLSASSGSPSSSSIVSSGSLYLFADAQILHDALSDVEREEARLQEEAAIAAGRGHRLGALYQQRRAQQRRRRQRARDGSRPLPRAPALVRIDPHSGAEEAFVAPAPAQRSIRIPKRRGIPGRGGGSGSSRTPTQQRRNKRLRATSVPQANEQQQTPADQQTTEGNKQQQITHAQDQPQLHQSQQEQPTQQHQELSEQQQLQQQHGEASEQPQQHQQAQQSQQQQQQQPVEPSLERDSRTANDTDTSVSPDATSDFSDPSMGPEELARAGMFEPGLVGRIGAVRTESRPEVEAAYFGQSVVSKVLVLDDSSPLATPSQSSATAVALMVLVPIIGLGVFYIVYTCTMEGRRVRHGSWDNDLAAAHDSINSAAARGAPGACSVPFRGGSVGHSGAAASAVGNAHKPKGKSKESAATRARRALGDLDADDDWEVPLCIDDVERGADDGL